MTSLKLVCSLVAALVLTPFVAQAQAAGTSYLSTNSYLRTNQYLVSPGSKYFAIMQSDGNFCVYKGSDPSHNQGYAWCNMVTAPSPTFAIMQSDGNFCVYKGTDPSHNLGYVWCNMSNGGTAPYYAGLGDNGAFAVYNGASPASTNGTRWSTPIPPLTYTITVPALSNGSVTVNSQSCAGGCAVKITGSAPVVITATANNKFTLGTWGGACAGKTTTSTCTLNLTDDATASVTFVEVPFVAAPNKCGAANCTFAGSTLEYSSKGWALDYCAVHCRSMERCNAFTYYPRTPYGGGICNTFSTGAGGTTAVSDQAGSPFVLSGLQTQ